MSGAMYERKPIIVKEEKRFCRSPQFSYEFPKRLNGIVHPDDFQQSIERINRASLPTLCEKILIFSLFLTSLLGLFVFVLGIAIKFIFSSGLWIVLMCLGLVLFMGFLTIALFVSSQIHRSCDTRLDRAIEAETRKYSTNLPVPIRWRLDMTIYARRLSDASPTDIQYYLLIDIGQKSDSESNYSSRLTLRANSKYPSHSNLSISTCSDRNFNREEPIPIHVTV